MVELLGQANISFKSLPRGITADEVVKQIQKELGGDYKSKEIKDSVNIYSNDCFTINLDLFINKQSNESFTACRQRFYSDLTSLFDSVIDLKLWPKDVQQPHAIIKDIKSKMSLGYFRVIIGSKDSLMVVGNPVHMVAFTPGIDKEIIDSRVAQFKELGSTYPNWVIQQFKEQQYL